MKSFVFSKTSVFTFISIIVFGLQGYSQYRHFKWQDPEPYTNIPDSLRDKDVVIVSLVKKIEFKEYNIIETALIRFRVLTLLGRDMYSKFVLPEYGNASKHSIIDARTIKPDGRIININLSDIKKSTIPGFQPDDPEFSEIRVAIPGVEVGDDIEYALIQIHPFKGINFSVNEVPFSVKREIVKAETFSIDDDLQNVFFHSELPVMKAVFELTTPASYKITYKTYNGFPEPKVLKKDSLLSITASMYNLFSLNDEPNICRHCQLPYMSYYVIPNSTFWEKEVVQSWEQAYEKSQKLFDPESATIWNSQNVLFDYLEREIKPCKDSGKVYQFAKAYDYIRMNIEMRPLKTFEKDYNLGYFFANKFIDKTNLMKLYRKAFEYLKIPYYYCYVRSKFEGSFDPLFFRPNEISTTILAFKDEKNRFHFVYPHGYLSSFNLDEIPFSYRGTEAIMVSRPDSIHIKKLTVPVSEIENNYAIRNFQIHINPNDTVVKLSAKISLSGDVSTEQRHLYELLYDMRKKAWKSGLKPEPYGYIDSVRVDYKGSTSPFVSRYFYSATIPIKVTKVDTNEFSLPIFSVISHEIQHGGSGKRWLDFIADYVYTDVNNVFLCFERNVEILNSSSFNISKENDFAMFKCNLNKISENTYVLNSVYAIKKPFIKAEEISRLREINESINDLRNFSLIIRN